jgi:hypothetical protein
MTIIGHQKEPKRMNDDFEERQRKFTKKLLIVAAIGYAIIIAVAGVFLWLG